MSKIEWTDETRNPVVGCTKIAEGCKHCYAKRLHDMRHKAYLAGKKLPKQYAKPFSEIQFFPERIESILHMRKPRRIFVCSMGDLFHEKVPFGYIDEIMAVIYYTSRRGHIHQILTKRLDRMLKYFNGDVNGRVLRIMRQKEWCSKKALLTCDVSRNRNLWLGTSISTQADADKNIPILLQIPAAVRFLSVEPMLEGIIILEHWLMGRPSLVQAINLEPQDKLSFPKLDLVIIGCESGPKRRPCKLEWVKDLIDQCDAASVPVFVKQLDINGKVSHKMNEWPEWARRQEYPKQ